MIVLVSVCISGGFSFFSFALCLTVCIFCICILLCLFSEMDLDLWMDSVHCVLQFVYFASVLHFVLWFYFFFGIPVFLDCSLL